MRVRRHAVTLALVGLSCALAIYLFVFDRGAVSTGEADARQHNVFTAFRRAELSRIGIAQGDARMSLVRRFDDSGNAAYDLLRQGATASAGDDARASENAAPADMGAVSKLLGELELAVRDRTLEAISEPGEWNALGLDSPRIVVTLQMGHITYEMAVGAAAPSPAGAAYARFKGKNRPFVIRRELVQQLQLPADSYRSKALVPYLASAIGEFVIRGRGQTTHLRRFDLQLRVETSHGWVRAERGAIDRLVSSLADLRAESFLERKEAEKVLAPEGERLTLELTPRDAGRPKAILELGGACPGPPGRRVAVLRTPEPRVDACVPEEVAEVLAVPADRLIDLHLFSLNPDETEQIVLGSGEARLELARLGTAWHLRAPTDATVDIDAGNELARHLTEMMASEIVGSSDAGAFSAKGEVVLTAVGDASPSAAFDGGAGGGLPWAGTRANAGAQQKIEVSGAEVGGFVLVRRSDDGVVLKVRAALARDLFPSVRAVRSRAVIDANLADVRRVRIDLDNVHQTLVRTSAGGWSLEEPKGFAVDPAVANEIALALTKLRADRWVADDDDGSYGWAAEHARLEIEMAPAAPSPPSTSPTPRSSDASGAHADASASGRTSVIVLGSLTTGGRFAKREGDRGVFVLPAALERSVATWAMDRSAFLLDLHGARTLYLRRGRDRFVFHLTDDQSQRMGPAQTERLAAVREALADLRAEAAVHAGAARKDEGFDKARLEVWLERASETGRLRSVHLVFGAGDVWQGMNVCYARRDGVNATFVIAQSRLKPLLDLR